MMPLLIRKVRRAAPATGGGGGGAPTDVPGPAGSASFSVAWDAPAHDEGGVGPGGGAVSVAGYVIDYATSSQTPAGTYPYRKVVAGASTVSGTVSSIAAGTYYLRMASYDSEGNVGNYGPELTKVAA